VALSAAAGATAVIVTANVAFAEGRLGPHGRRRGGQFLFFLPLLILFAIAALLLVLWQVRHPVAPRPPTALPMAPPTTSPTLNAEAILADRLARGEITPDEYRAAITVLRETAPPAPPG
jgi:uncharacterized membrane protein